MDSPTPQPRELKLLLPPMKSRTPANHAVSSSALQTTSTRVLRSRGIKRDAAMLDAAKTEGHMQKSLKRGKVAVRAPTVPEPK